ncbi:hypothetical protein Taro_040955, partial [Colocasia esculenta]|nr:hypothetical protein [Colocasia esculenta]
HICWHPPRPSPKRGFEAAKPLTLSLSLSRSRRGNEERKVLERRPEEILLPAGMFRSTKGFLLRKLLGSRTDTPSCTRVPSSSASLHNVLTRYMSHEPLPLHRGRYAARFPPLSRPLPGLTLPPPISDNVGRHPTKITVLPNGLKVASEDSIENFTADRMVLAAYGLDHDRLLAIAEPMLHDLRRGPPLTLPQSSYIGGEIRHQVDSEVNKKFLIGFYVVLSDKLRISTVCLSLQQRTHVALAFEVPGGWREDKDATTMTVLQCYLLTVFDGWWWLIFCWWPWQRDAFKTLYVFDVLTKNLQLSYLRVLNKYRQVQSIEAFSSMYNDSGLFGIHLTTGAECVENLVRIAADELLAVATPGQVTEIEFQRAKNAVKSAILVNLESRMIIAEDIGRQLLTYGHRKPQYFLQLLDDLTLDDLTTVAQRILSTKLTMACLGDVDRVPSYEAVSQLFPLSNAKDAE